MADRRVCIPHERVRPGVTDFLNCQNWRWVFKIETHLQCRNANRHEIASEWLLRVVSSCEDRDWERQESPAPSGVARRGCKWMEQRRVVQTGR